MAELEMSKKALDAPQGGISNKLSEEVSRLVLNLMFFCFLLLSVRFAVQ